MTATAEQISHAPTHRLALAPEDMQEISRQAAQLRPIDALQTVVGGLLFWAGWLATKLFVKGWLFLFPVLAWLYVAVRSGSRVARGAAVNQPTVEQLLAENDRLRLELARVS